MVQAASGRVSRAPPYSGNALAPPRRFAYGACTPSGRPSNAVRLRLIVRFHWAPYNPSPGAGLGFSAFARRYSRNRFCFPFLRVLRCFNSPGNGPCAIAHGRRPVSGTAGSPIRTPPDRWMLGSSPGRFAARRVLPPGACQGIRRTLFFACSLENCSAVRGPPPASESSSTFRKALLSFLCVVRFSGYPARRRLSRTPGRRKGQHCVFS